MAQVHLRVDMALAHAQIEDFVRQALLLPEGAADLLQRNLLGLLDRPDAGQFLSLERLPATGAGDLVFQARILGLEELLAAAALDGERDRQVQRGRQLAQVDDDRMQIGPLDV